MASSEVYMWLPERRVESLSVAPSLATALLSYDGAIYQESTSPDVLDSYDVAETNVHQGISGYRHPVYSGTAPHGETEV
jgi:hypothetical protein